MSVAGIIRRIRITLITGVITTIDTISPMPMPTVIGIAAITMKAWTTTVTPAMSSGGAFSLTLPESVGRVDCIVARTAEPITARISL
jgi:hypothetical protein